MTSDRRGPWSWVAVGLGAGILCFVLLKAFNLMFVDPAQPFASSDAIAHSSSFILYWRDLARLALIGAAIVAPLAAWGRRGTAADNWFAAFIGAVLGAIAGVVTIIAVGFLFSSDAVAEYFSWFSSGSLDGFAEALKWSIRLPWTAAWAVFGGFAGWYVATQTNGKLGRAAALGALLGGIAAFAGLELGLQVNDIDPDAWTFALCELPALAVALAAAGAGERVPQQTAPEPALVGSA